MGLTNLMENNCPMKFYGGGLLEREKAPDIVNYLMGPENDSPEEVGVVHLAFNEGSVHVTYATIAAMDTYMSFCRSSKYKFLDEYRNVRTLVDWLRNITESSNFPKVIEILKRYDYQRGISSFEIYTIKKHKS